MLRVSKKYSSVDFTLSTWHWTCSSGLLIYLLLQAAAAAKGIADLQQNVLDDAKVDSEEHDSLKEENKEIEGANPEEASEEDARRKAALNKLESASEDSFLGQVWTD